ncbi:hypothetical protein PR048_033319 [Dryococelus australis]|uniref:Uncharacterized protein n=1 Tax=Dryococelus australis TaxID=614101 RepID=A0ABQ9G327_9NEOP|nr:hypothetical protein PR048_033319 [Dryococelus australis]
MSLIGGFSRGSLVSPNLEFRRCYIPTSFHPHRLSRSLFIRHAPGNPAPINERSTTVCANQGQFTQKGSDLRSRQQPMEKQCRLEYIQYCEFQRVAKKNNANDVRPTPQPLITSECGNAPPPQNPAKEKEKEKKFSNRGFAGLTGGLSELRRDVQGVLTSGLCVLCGLVRETSSARREIQLLQPYGWYKGPHKGPSTPPALSFGNDERERENVSAEKQFSVGTPRLAMRSQRDRSTPSLSYGPTYVTSWLGFASYRFRIADQSMHAIPSLSIPQQEWRDLAVNSRRQGPTISCSRAYTPHLPPETLANPKFVSVIRPGFIVPGHETTAEEYATCIQVDLKQGLQKCSFYCEQPILELSRSFSASTERITRNRKISRINLRTSLHLNTCSPKVILAIGSQFIRHALDDSEPIADLQ